jgi:hypothetical protein
VGEIERDPTWQRKLRKRVKELNGDEARVLMFTNLGRRASLGNG